MDETGRARFAAGAKRNDTEQKVSYGKDWYEATKQNRRTPRQELGTVGQCEGSVRSDVSLRSHGIRC